MKETYIVIIFIMIIGMMLAIILQTRIISKMELKQENIQNQIDRFLIRE